MTTNREDVEVRVRQHLGRVLARLSERGPADPQPDAKRPESLDGAAEVDREDDLSARVRNVNRPT